MSGRKYIDPSEAAEGRTAAENDWTAGTVKTDQDVAMWNHSSYALAYTERIGELKAGHSSRGSTE